VLGGRWTPTKCHLASAIQCATVACANTPVAAGNLWGMHLHLLEFGGNSMEGRLQIYSASGFCDHVCSAMDLSKVHAIPTACRPQRVLPDS